MKQKIQQLSLFELPKVEYKEIEDEYPYIIYISTSKGNCTGIIYECKHIDGCQELCSMKETKGTYLGVEWAYFFTKKSNLDKNDFETYLNLIKGRKSNNRKSDDIFLEEFLSNLGMRKII